MQKVNKMKVMKWPLSAVMPLMAAAVIMQKDKL